MAMEIVDFVGTERAPEGIIRSFFYFFVDFTGIVG